jgi:predicted nucleotidyltransferase
MKIDKLTRTLRLWAVGKPFIRRVFLFGSRAKGTYGEDSDLDIAIEFDKFENDSNHLATWLSESGAWKKEIEALIPNIKIDFQWHDPSGSTEVIDKGIKDCSLIVYERQ